VCDVRAAQILKVQRAQSERRSVKGGHNPGWSWKKLPAAWKARQGFIKIDGMPRHSEQKKENYMSNRYKVAIKKVGLERVDPDEKKAGGDRRMWWTAK